MPGVATPSTNQHIAVRRRGPRSPRLFGAARSGSTTSTGTGAAAPKWKCCASCTTPSVTTWRKSRSTDPPTRPPGSDQYRLLDCRVDEDLCVRARPVEFDGVADRAAEGVSATPISWPGIMTFGPLSRYSRLMLLRSSTKACSSAVPELLSRNGLQHWGRSTSRPFCPHLPSTAHPGGGISSSRTRLTRGSD
jgi:hypothetical protein